MTHGFGPNLVSFAQRALKRFAIFIGAVGPAKDGRSGWPAELLTDDGRPRSWHQFLVESVCCRDPELRLKP
jgi:hypothetical protein